MTTPTHLVLSGIRVKFVTQSSVYYRSIYGSLIDNFLKELKYFRRQLWRAGGTQAKKLQRQIDNTFKAVAVMLPSPILNLGRVSSFQIFLLYLYFLHTPRPKWH